MQSLYFLHFNNCVVSYNFNILKNFNFSLSEFDLLRALETILSRNRW